MSNSNAKDRDVCFWPCLPDYPEQYRAMQVAGRNESEIFMELSNNDVFNPVRECSISSYEDLLEGINDMKTYCDRFPSIFLIIDGKNYFSPDYETVYSLDSRMENKKPADLSVLWNADEI